MPVKRFSLASLVIVAVAVGTSLGLIFRGQPQEMSLFLLAFLVYLVWARPLKGLGLAFAILFPPRAPSAPADPSVVLPRRSWTRRHTAPIVTPLGAPRLCESADDDPA